MAAAAPGHPADKEMHMSTGAVATRPWYLALVGVLMILWIVFGSERSEAFFDRARG
jgi:hypothetical protein